MKLAALLFAALMLTHPNATAQPSGDELTDTQKLGMALDYFTGGKYHEALMMFVKLDKSYKLNPRFKAYIGVCYFHEWEYEQACRYFDAAIPYLDAYAPAERSVYYGMAAESHFNLQEYDKAVPLYERKILVCNINERAGVISALYLSAYVGSVVPNLVIACIPTEVTQTMIAAGFYVWVVACLIGVLAFVRKAK